MMRKFFTKRIRHYGLLIISLLLLGLLIYTIDFEVFIGQISNISISTLFLVLIIYGITWIFRSIRLRQLVPQKLSTLDSFSIQIAGFALNLIYPAKLGDLFMGSFLKQKINLNYQQSLAYILHLRVLDFLVLILVGTLSVFFVPDKVFAADLWKGISIAGVLVFLFGLTMFLFNKTKILDLLSNILPQKINITPLLQQLAKFHNFNLVYFLSICWTLFIWGLEILTCYLIAIVLLPDIGIFPIVSAIAIGNLMKALPLFPGGLGTYEAGFILLLSLHGVSYEIAISLSIIDHLLKKAVNLIFGFPIYLYLQKEENILDQPSNIASSNISL